MDLINLFPDDDVGKPEEFLRIFFLFEKGIVLFCKFIQRLCCHFKVDNEIQWCGAAQLLVDQAHALEDLGFFTEVINKLVLHLEPGNAEAAG